MSDTLRTEEEVQSTAPFDESATCPYLGLLDDPDTHALFPRVDHRCQVPGSITPTPDSDWQERYCLSGRHDQCPLYRAVSQSQTAHVTPVPTSRRWRLWTGGLIVVVAALLVCAAVLLRIGGVLDGSNQPQRQDVTHQSGLVALPTATRTTVPPLAAKAASSTDVVTATTLPATPSSLASSTSQPHPTATPSQEPPTPTPALLTASPSVRTYTVVAGDTLLDIAQRFSVVEQQLIDLNQITDPNVIYAGEVLQLPPP